LGTILDHFPSLSNYTTYLRYSVQCFCIFSCTSILVIVAWDFCHCVRAFSGVTVAYSWLTRAIIPNTDTTLTLPASKENVH
jgi:hypothetical protein